VGAQYKTGEVAKSEWQTVQQSPPWAVDAWGLGCLMQEAFTGRTLTRTEELRNTESIPQAVLQVTSHAVCPDADQQGTRRNPDAPRLSTDQGMLPVTAVPAALSQF